MRGTAYKRQIEAHRMIATSSNPVAIEIKMNLIADHPWYTDLLDRIITGEATDAEIRSAILRMRKESPPKKLRDFLD